jgi:hypothetical protein
VVIKSGRPMRGTFGVSVSNLDPVIEVDFLYPHFFVKWWASSLASPWWRRHGIPFIGC